MMELFSQCLPRVAGFACQPIFPSSVVAFLNKRFTSRWIGHLQLRVSRGRSFHYCSTPDQSVGQDKQLPASIISYTRLPLFHKRSCATACGFASFGNIHAAIPSRSPHFRSTLGISRGHSTCAIAASNHLGSFPTHNTTTTTADNDNDNDMGDRNILPGHFKAENYDIVLTNLDFEKWTYHGSVTYASLPLPACPTATTMNAVYEANSYSLYPSTVLLET